ncbi:hypothetical protein [Chondromyces crocatus]|uniref:Uncharacterized protein n=1 Tax=Chondromyces crocatus TaxID=52 RepID=A0A0K1EKJ6_CHOCO|nr:hypothetical protein [Chondromyces crocatus]AKT41395.1 uncharacterized protein CMC5_055950 [Chondromyces crocatus]
MASPKPLLPDCGLYLTTRPLPGNEEKVPAGIIVSFHNHSDGGLPTVTPPDHNIHNRWHFHGPPLTFRGLTWAETLQKLPKEGFYTLRRELTFDGGKWPKATLVQLGYTQQGNPILFIARVRANLEENDLHFSDRGVGIKREQFSILEAVTVYDEPSDGSGHQPDHAHDH